MPRPQPADLPGLPGRLRRARRTTVSPTRAARGSRAERDLRALRGLRRRRRCARLDARARSASRGQLRELGRPHACGRSARRARCSGAGRACRPRARSPRAAMRSGVAASSIAFVARRSRRRTPDADAAAADAARLAARAASRTPSLVPLLGLVALPFLIVLSPFLILSCASARPRDPEICPRPTAAALLEACSCSRTSTSATSTRRFGSVKPGWFRRWLLTLLLVAIQFACRHVFTRGYLARVQTIHFARWVFLDDKTRVRVHEQLRRQAPGLHGRLHQQGRLGPESRVQQRHRLAAHRLADLRRGAHASMPFKYYQRRHQLPTQVWYKAYPGLTLIDMTRNHRIRAGPGACPG